MSIGRGWYPPINKDDVQLIAEELLREKLTYIFDKWREKWLKNGFINDSSA